MVKIALLGEQYAAQLRENPSALEGLEVAYCGPEVSALREKVVPGTLDALVLDLGAMSDAPDEEVRSLIETCGAELVMVTYTFTRRYLLRALQREGLRVFQAPLSLSILRAHLSALMVRAVLGDGRPASNARPPSVAVVRPAEVLQAASERLQRTAPAPARRFDGQQLGRLMEVASTVQCECPNQLAQLVNALNGFEDYSRSCANRDDADARMHAYLSLKTGEARAVLEEALGALLVHEKLAV